MKEERKDRREGKEKKKTINKRREEKQSKMVEK